MVKRWLAILLFPCWRAAGAHPLADCLASVDTTSNGMTFMAHIPLNLPGVDVAAWLGETDTAPLVVMALMWMMFLGGLGVAQWRARRSPG